jgi:hypothetical protein
MTPEIRHFRFIWDNSYVHRTGYLIDITVPPLHSTTGNKIAHPAKISAELWHQSHVYPRCLQFICCLSSIKSGRIMARSSPNKHPPEGNQSKQVTSIR